jgi:hypothetical protein
MKVYITKYATTIGIFKKEGNVSGEHPNMFCCPKNEYGHTEYYHKPYWHESLEEAKKHAEDLRQKQIKALQKKLQKLENLKF